MTDEIELTDAKIKRLQNLRYYKDKSPDEIRAMVAQRQQAVPKSKTTNKTYEQRFDDKLHVLESEYQLDMNSSNDVLMLHNLVRQLIQAEDTDRDIRTIQDKPEKTKEDIGTLKALGEFQRDIQITIADLQDKLGITRKVRKEKQVDDIPVWIDGLLTRAKTYWANSTFSVDCPRCDIELGRYWLNFPEETTLVAFTTQCPHCHETVQYNR